LGRKASDDIAASWKDAHAGPLNAGKILILEEGMKWEAMSMTLEDAEPLASRGFTVEEIARLFNIPLPILEVWEGASFARADAANGPKWHLVRRRS
jgi:phage portal protein BeeE